MEKMKVLTVLGTRPEIIRLSRIIERLDRVCDHVLVHTGQNFDPQLSDIFFDQLQVRKPNHYLGIRKESFGQQAGEILAKIEPIFRKEKPDALLILGDTNSGLSTIIAKRQGIQIFHLEAGNRCYDDRVPEEVNRRIIDHSSDILMPYTHRSKENLLREGIAGQKIYVVGNPIGEVISHFNQPISSSKILTKLKIKPKKYFLVTMHRAENVDIESRLRNLTRAIQAIQKKYQFPVIISLHPRTRQKMQQFGIKPDARLIRFSEPFGFFDFIALEKSAFCVLSDSGTVQEECCLFQVPNLTIRDTTERPETLECGSNILSGCEVEQILQNLNTVLSLPGQWNIPVEYTFANVSTSVIKIITGYWQKDQRQPD